MCVYIYTHTLYFEDCGLGSSVEIMGYEKLYIKMLGRANYKRLTHHYYIGIMDNYFISRVHRLNYRENTILLLRYSYVAREGGGGYIFFVKKAIIHYAQLFNVFSVFPKKNTHCCHTRLSVCPSVVRGK